MTRHPEVLCARGFLILSVVSLLCRVRFRTTRRRQRADRPRLRRKATYPCTAHMLLGRHRTVLGRSPQMPPQGSLTMNGSRPEPRQDSLFLQRGPDAEGTLTFLTLRPDTHSGR